MVTKYLNFHFMGWHAIVKCFQIFPCRVFSNILSINEKTPFITSWRYTLSYHYHHTLHICHGMNGKFRMPFGVIQFVLSGLSWSTFLSEYSMISYCETLNRVNGSKWGEMKYFLYLQHIWIGLGNDRQKFQEQIHGNIF